MRYLALFLLAGFLATGCDSGGSEKESELRRRIREASGDGVISPDELANLQSFAQTNEEIKKYGDCTAMQDMITQVMAQRGMPELPKCNAGNTTNVTVSTSGNFNVYVENSASMFGYMLGATEFREAMMDIPSRLVGAGMKGDFFFINDQTYPATKEYRAFVDMLNKEKAGAKEYGNTAKASNSKLDDILQRIVNDVVSKKTLAIFTSDCIFDIDGKRPQDELPNQKFKIKATMQQFKQRGDYGALVMRFTSAFEGNYYDCKNGKKALKGVHRPFYIWVLGASEQLRTLVKDYNLTNVRGFRNHAFFYNSDHTADKLYYSFLERTKREGEFTRPSTKTDRILALESADVDGSTKTLKVAVAVDLSKMPAEDSYMLNAENWLVKSDKDDPFTVASVEAISPSVIHNNDKRFLGTATHLLVLETNKLTPGVQHLDVALKKELPVWVSSASVDDDTNVLNQLDKTFGLKYLIEGVAEAFDESGKEAVYCKMKLEISK